MKCCVAQLGSRMHYAVPRILHGSGSLERLYTDIVAAKGPAAMLRFIPDGMKPAGIKALSDRVPEGVPCDMIETFDLFALGYFFRRSSARSREENTNVNLRAGRSFCGLVVRSGLGRADTVYAFQSAALEIFRHAGEKGIRCVLEQTIAPRSVETDLLSKEQERFPGWFSGDYGNAADAEYSIREKAEWLKSDLIVCGSEFVKEGMISCGVLPDRIVVVPYGVSRPEYRPSEGNTYREPPLHVLFAGTAGIRKGIGDLSEAVRLLPRGTAEVRAVGSIALTPSGVRAAGRWITFLGRVQRSRMVEQYRWSHVFVLPTICEGSAAVIYEALAEGLPVVTTANAGSIVRDGKDGFIVPVRSPGKIAEKLSFLANNPDVVAEMSCNARARSREFTVERYGERLLDALKRRPEEPV